MNVEIIVGIVVIVMAVLGAVSILVGVFKEAVELYGQFVKPAKARHIRHIKVGHSRTLTPYDQVPQYKGKIGLFGLPCYRDVMVPDKHNYKTVVYMDRPVKQWVYDWMSSWKAVANNKENPYGVFALLCFLALPFLFNKALGIAILAAVVLLFIFGAPSGKRAVRRMAENAKDFTPSTWRQIYKEVAESKEREDEMARAFRKSGGGWGRW